MRAIVIAAASLIVIGLAGCTPSEPETIAWTDGEARLIASLSLASLPALPPDPSNAVADDPAAAALGKALFFDARLSGNGGIACATCHLPERQFQDDRALGRGIGLTNRRTMPIAGTARSPWLFWDGRKDSQWSQALGPLESPVEHGTDRTAVVHLIAAHYAAEYEALFGPLPELSGLPAHAAPAGNAETAAAWESLPAGLQDQVNRVFANAGKAIAAFERTIEPEPTRFDAFAAAIAAGVRTANLLSPEEQAGLRVFLGKGSCINCHNGPLFTDNHFHNTGVPGASGLPEDVGRAAATRIVREDPFNCLGPYSDARPDDCAELRFMTLDGEELVRAFRTPSLRGAAGRAPYMHAGQIGSLAAVIAHYDRAEEAPAGHSELRPLGLTSGETRALEAFLRTLEPEISGM